MPSIKGIEVKNIEGLGGLEGYGLKADLFLHGKKVGLYVNEGNGGDAVVRFEHKEDEEAVMRVVFEYAKENPNIPLVAMYQHSPDLYEKEVKRIKEYFPYLEGEITMEAVSAFDIEVLVCELFKLTNYETIYMEDLLPDGYRAMSVSKNGLVGYPEDWTDERIREAAKGEKLFMCLQDFYVD